MPATIPVGQSGTLRFLPEQAGLTQAMVSGVSWQPQGSQQHVKFTPPDKVEGLSVGTGSYRCTVTLTTQGEKVTYAFDAQCTAPAGTLVMTPVAIDIAPPVTPP